MAGGLFDKLFSTYFDSLDGRVADRNTKKLSIMARTNYEFTLTMVDKTGKRFDQGTFKGFNGLTEAHKMAQIHGVDTQVTHEEAKREFHAHIMEFRDDEHYNDIYLV